MPVSPSRRELSAVLRPLDKSAGIDTSLCSNRIIRMRDFTENLPSECRDDIISKKGDSNRGY